MTSQNVQQETCWAPIMLLIRILPRELGDGELRVRSSRPESAFVRRGYKKVQKGTRRSIPQRFPPTEQNGRDWNTSHGIPSSISQITQPALRFPQARGRPKQLQRSVLRASWAQLPGCMRAICKSEQPGPFFLSSPRDRSALHDLLLSRAMSVSRFDLNAQKTNTTISWMWLLPSALRSATARPLTSSSTRRTYAPP